MIFYEKVHNINRMDQANDDSNTIKRNDDGFLEYDYDYYESNKYTFLYVDCKVGLMSERQLRNAFSKYATIFSCNVRTVDDKRTYGFISVSTGSEAKECIKRSVLMEINGHPLFVSFQDENIRNHGYKKNYKCIINRRMSNDSRYQDYINILSYTSQHQARALLHDRNLFNEWKNFHFYGI